MNKLILFLILVSCGFVSSQDLFIPNNPYEEADEITKSRNAFNRERWFYEQRMFPFNFLPPDAYSKAMEQKQHMRNQNGFYYDNSAPWTNLGPTPGFYFSYSNIAGRTTTMVYDPTNPNIVYIGTAFGGVWKSTNGGLNWTAKTDFEVSLSSGALAIDPNNPNIIYYGTGEATYSAASYYGRGLLKSTNGGDTWVNYTGGLEPLTYFSRIVIKPGNSNYLLAALGSRSSLGVIGGLYRSTDGGLNWTAAATGRCDDVVFSPSGDSVYAIGSGTGYIISTDGGMTFTNSGALSAGTRSHLAICKSAPNIMYSSRHSGSSISVYKSTNGGFNFTQVAASVNFSGGQAWYDFYMHVNPFDPLYAYVGSIDIWRTTDGGTTFANITNGYAGGYVHVDQHNVAFHPTNSSEMFCVNDGGVWKSIDRGTTWVNLNVTLTLTQFYRIASDPSNASHILGGTQDNGTQRTLGTPNWAAAFGGDGGEVCFHDQNNLYMLGETQNNGVRRSQDGGNSWVSATSGLSGSGAWVGPLISHPDSSGIFYTARQQVFKTTTWGASWFGISSGTAGVIREMAISNSSSNIMFATSGSFIYKSTDRGYTYNSVTAGLPGRTITSVYVHPDSSNVVLVTFSGFGAGKVYKSTNGGTNWNDISGNLPDSPANDVLIYYPGTATSIYLLGNDVGVFITNDYGTTWTELADGLPNTVAIHLDYNQAANKLRVGTHGRGVWETIVPVGIINYNNEIPKDYSLSQNYPNPFNPTTNIKFSIPGGEFVTLKIYDIVGKEISVLVNENLKPGTYEVSFDGEKLSSGLYFYKLNSGSYSETKKMILVK